MSKFNNRVLWELPFVDSLETFKDAVFIQLTNYEQSILRIAKAINQEFQANEGFRGLIIIVLVVIIVGSILRYLGKRKHSFYRKQSANAAEMNKFTKSLKAQMDNLRKYVIEFMSAPHETRQSLYHGTNESNLENHLRDLERVLDIYNRCVKTNIKFNEYFLDEFVRVFKELKELKRGKGIRTSTSRRKEMLVNHTLSNNIQKKEPMQPQAVPRAEVSQEMPKSIQQTSATPTSALVQEHKQQNIESSAHQRNAPSPKQDLEPADQPVMEGPPSQFNRIFSDNMLESHKQPHFDNTSETLKQSLDTQTSSTTTENVQPEAQSQQMSDDPLRSIPTAPPSAKHVLPTLPIKPKREIPVGVRRPPPPLRK